MKFVGKDKIVTRAHLADGIMYACAGMSDDDLNIVNISWGVSDSIYDRKLKKNVRKSDEQLIQDYAEEVVHYATIASRCGKHNFIITKAMGNERVHNMDDAFMQVLKHRDMDSVKLKALKDHIVIVAAKDTRKEYPKEYSNRMRDGVKLEGINTIMVDLSHLPVELSGTSAAAPLVAGWVAKAQFQNSGDAIKAINSATKVGELVSEQEFRKTAKTITKESTQQLLNLTDEGSVGGLSLEGVLKMYKLSSDGSVKLKTATHDLDYTEDYIAFVVETDRPIDVYPYLDESEREFLDNTMQSSFMIVSSQGCLKRKFAQNYAYKRVHITGHPYVPLAGWRNATDVVIDMNSIGLSDKNETEVSRESEDRYSEKNRIAQDLIGQVIYEPSGNGYFPEEWRWKIEKGEVLGVEILNTKVASNYSDISVLAHLKRGSMKVDAGMVLTYENKSYTSVLRSSRVTKLQIPQQTDYSDYVNLTMDYDFLPSLIAYNNSSVTLFVGGDYFDGNGKNYFGTIIEPNSKSTIAIGAIKSYHIHFAYKK